MPFITIATVSEKDFVRGVGEGSCTIFLSTHNGLRTTITVTVTGGPEELKFDKKSYKLSVGKTLKLKKELTMLPEGTKAEVKWKSSDKKIATVDENGKVTAKKEGTVTITATASNGVTATVKIKIK
jgi:membrane carboxypeptidase/penicillin-binding protein PbpC